MLTDFRERGRREGRKKDIDVRGKYQLVALVVAPTGDGTHKLGMSPDPGLNCNLLVCMTTPEQLSHLARGTVFYFIF